MVCKIRPYRPEDRDRVRHICCETGFMGNPIEPVFSDRQLFADFFTAYYTEYEPESALVAIDEETGKLVGYLLGCSRYRYNAFLQNLLIATRVVPRALFRYLIGRYDRQSRRFLYWTVFKSISQTPKTVPRATHFHINLLPKYRTGEASRRLFFPYVDSVKTRGDPALYFQIQIQDDKRTWFFERLGFKIIDKKRVTKFSRYYDRPVYVATVCKFSMPDPIRSLIVSFHDLHPRSREACEQFLGLAEKECGVRDSGVTRMRKHRNLLGPGIRMDRQGNNPFAVPTSRCIWLRNL